MSEHPKGYCPAFGNYPKEYNRAIHGPFYSFVNYGPKETPLWDVKLGELKPWLAKKPKAPWVPIQAFSRMIHRWDFNWRLTKYGPTSKGWFQFIIIYSTVCGLSSYHVLKSHRSHKYHW